MQVIATVFDQNIVYVSYTYKEVFILSRHFDCVNCNEHFFKNVPTPCFCQQKWL